MPLPDLTTPTPANEIKRREGPRGRMLDYIDARYVMDRLDAAVGQAGWQDRYNALPSGSVECGIGILIEGEWIWKWDVGDQSDIEPTKGSYSDAFKRAAVKWGIGRDLYGDHAARPAATPRPAEAPRPSVVPSGPSSGGMTAKAFFEAAEAAGVDRKKVSEVAKDLFGQWQVTSLTAEQRSHLLAELTHAAGRDTGPVTPQGGGDRAKPAPVSSGDAGAGDAPIWEGVA